MSQAQVQSVSTTAWTPSISTLTLSKPSGTVDGDLLIAVVAVKSPDAVNSVPSGWTDKGSKGTYYACNIYTKIAASEGSSWNWGLDATTTATGFVLRIDGHKSTGFYDQEAAATVTNSATPSFANTITPSAANCLLLFLVQAQTAGSATGVGSYAIATSNPTWTEWAELYNSSDDLYLTLAAGTRAAATATGNSSCALGTASTDTKGIIISILSEPNATVSASVLDITMTAQTPSVSGAGNVTAGVAEMTITAPAPTASSPSPDWVNPHKSSTATFLNQDKS